MLNDIINNEESVRQTFDVLHQALITKVPMCTFARLGGEEGGRISRSAFAVILKFSDSLEDFDSLQSSVAQHADKSVKQIVDELKAQKSKWFDSMLKSFETAN